MYDGFISYSHAADDLLAPRLQAGLQRFAKPWWKRRALRIFRDESSLAANPHLWSSITEALDSSDWFVLLLSEDAASSEWVGREIEHWVTHKDPDRILPVVTGGEFGWNNGGVEGTSVPPALRGMFSEEPRWVDLRFARDEEHLDLNNPQFSNAIADVASAIRGVPKDELASEEVRQHRRTVRTAWAAGAMLLILAVAAVGFGIQSANNAERAEAEASRANDEAERANQEAERAEANSAAEAEARAQADRNAQLARSRELAASAIGVRDENPELATLLAIASIDTAPTGSGLFPEGLISLREALDANRLLDRLELDSGGDIFLEFSADGEALFVSSLNDRSVSRYSIIDDRIAKTPDWVFRDESTIDSFEQVVVHPAGTEIAVVVTNWHFAGDPGDQVELDDEGQDRFPGRVLLLDAVTGELRGLIPLGDCLEPRSFSPIGYTADGSSLLALLESADCADDPTWWGTVFFDTSTWEETHRFDRAAASIDQDMTRVLVHRRGDPLVELRSFGDLGLIDEFELDVGAVWMSLVPDGRTIVIRYENGVDLRPGFWDIETEQLLAKGDAWEGFVIGAHYTGDGRVLVPSTESDVIYDPRTGRKLVELPTAWSLDSDISPDDRLAVTSSRNAVVELWDISSRASGRFLSEGDKKIFWLNPDVIDDGVKTALWGFPDFEEPWVGLWLSIVDPESGRLDHQVSVRTSDQLPDGRFVIVPTEATEDGLLGPLSIWDPESGSVTPIQDCSVRASDYEDPQEYLTPWGSKCADGDIFFGEYVVVSADGSLIAAVGYEPDAAPSDPNVPHRDILVRMWAIATGEVQRTLDLELDLSLGSNAFGPMGDGWLLLMDGAAGNEAGVVYKAIDIESGEEVAVLRQEGDWRETREITRDASTLYLVEEGGRVWEYDTTTWLPTRDWQAMEGRPRGMALSPDESLLAVSGEDEFIVIWRIDGDEPVLVDRIPVGAWPSDITWIDEDQMGVAILHSAGRTEWRVVDLDAESILDAARGTLVRGFTSTECTTYGIDPCPTLEEIKTGS